MVMRVQNKKPVALQQRHFKSGGSGFKYGNE